MKENEIRKKETFDMYLKLVQKDVKKLFEFNKFLPASCPACNGKDFKAEFIKENFKYVSCSGCNTLFVSPRPSYEMLNKFYSDSESTEYWVKEFFMPVAEVRREKIFKPRAEFIVSCLGGKDQLVVGDIGAGFGLFLEELRKLRPAWDYCAIEPSVDMSKICADKGFISKPSCLEDINDMDGKFDLLTAFELMEHLFDPREFIKKTSSLLKKGGHLLLTTLNGEGFDILLLWEKSKSIFPPHHLNFFNTRSMSLLLNSCGLEVISVETPGQLDWDIVEGMNKKDNVDLGRFWNYFSRNGNEEQKKQLQEWISNNKLSSHMRILAKKI